MPTEENRRQREVPLTLWIVSGKNSIQVFMMLFAIATALPNALGATASASVRQLLEGEVILIQIWGLLVSIGAVVNLVGAYWRSETRPEVGLKIEIASCIILIPATMIYPIALLIYAPSLGSAWNAIGITSGFAGACAGRLWQCWRSLREVRDVRREISRDH